MLSQIHIFRNNFKLKIPDPLMFQWGAENFVESHFVDNQKVDQKYDHLSIVPMTFWHTTFGVLPMATNACEGSVKLG